MNPLRLATLDASPFSHSEKGEGLRHRVELRMCAVQGYYWELAGGRELRPVIDAAALTENARRRVPSGLEDHIDANTIGLVAHTISMEG